MGTEEAFGEALAEYLEGFGQYFKRSESRATAQRYIRGLLGEVGRKNCWQLAEKMGDADPQAMQRLLYEAEWDADAVCQAMRQQIKTALGDVPGVGVIDESGFVKKGDQSAGVQRQYCGRVGKIENCQMGVFLGYITAQGHTFLDRELYLPEAWCTDRERRQKAQIPPEILFQTKPQLAAQMLERAWAEGFLLQWVVGDSTYGNSPELRRRIHQAHRWYVLEVAKTLGVNTPVQARQSVEQLVQNTPAETWQTFILSCGEKGLITAQWLALPIQLPDDDTGVNWLLVRQDNASPTALTYCVSNAPLTTPLAELVHVAASRYHIEQLFEEAKGSAGLADYEVRFWQSWYRHITLSLVAHTGLTLIRHAIPQKKG